MSVPLHLTSPEAIEHDATMTLISGHLEAGRLQMALDAANEALRTCLPSRRPALMCMQCSIFVAMGKPLEALRVATTARELALAMNDTLLAAETNLALAFALQALEDHSRAIDIAAECQAVAKARLEHELLARAWRMLAASYSVLGRHQQAVDLLEQCLPLMEAHGRWPGRILFARYSLILAQSGLVSSTDVGSEHASAKQRALVRDWLAFADDADANELVRLSAMALGQAGIAARRAGDLELALETLSRALEVQNAIGLRGHAAVTKNHMGAVLQALGRSQEAIAVFGRAIALLQDGNPRELATAWEELSRVYESIGDHRAALAALQQTRALERKIRDDAAHIAALKLEQRAEITRLADQWTRLASEDALTGIANRRAFDRRLATLMEGAESGRAFALVMFDLDHFKRINDQYGHAVGDAVLKRFAALLKRDRRSEDLAARLGGEEFALLLTVETEQQAHSVAERIRAELDREVWTDIAVALKVTTSVGLAHSDAMAGLDQSLRHIVSLADQRLYRAKNAGRNRVVSGD